MLNMNLSFGFARNGSICISALKKNVAGYEGFHGRFENSKSPNSGIGDTYPSRLLPTPGNAIKIRFLVNVQRQSQKLDSHPDPSS